jgi:phosphate:Na+ symporter
MAGLDLAGGLAGGVGLFLLGMWMMTEGLKLSAGPQLEQVLGRATRSRGRGLAAGVLVTAIVQSSSAVTVATIGFVNAGLLNLSQALWVLFGANVGTTMTGWLVAVVGLKFKIEVLALPLVGVGMLLRMGGEVGRRGGLGMAVAGFGILFIGIDTLQGSFAGLAATFRLPAGTTALDTLLQLLAGVVLTVLMQSSSAALAVVLTAAQGGMLSLHGAAAVLIGSNIGTTVTALLAAIGATPNARRAAAAHVLFNAITGLVALGFLPWLVEALGALADAAGLTRSPAALLALFHTSFNLLGVLLMWPMAERLTQFLEGCFRTQEEDEARPRFLDANVLSVPTLALGALDQELRRLGALALRMIEGVLGRTPADALARDRRAAERLQLSIAEFIVQVNRKGMSQTSARRLPELLRVARYYETVADQATQAAAAAQVADPMQTPSGKDLRQRTQALLAAIDPTLESTAFDTIDAELNSFEAAYQAVKFELLQAGTQGTLPVARMDAALQAASALRRAAQQGVKGVQRLAGREGPDADAGDG